MTRTCTHPATLSGALLAALALAAATPTQAVTLTAFASMHDAFGTTANVTDTPAPLNVGAIITGMTLPTLSATARDAETGGGGSAYAKGAEFDHSQPSGHVELGVAAAARSQGNRVGAARASAFIDFEIGVEITLPDNTDPILGTLVSICKRDGNCNLSVDFLHQTNGRFSYSSFLTRDAGAQFSETLVVGDKGSSGFAAINGAQALGGGAATPSVGGNWQLADFVSSSDAAGENVLSFNHFELIHEVHGNFHLGGITPNTMVAKYTAHLAQEAVAGFGSSDYAFGAVAADFAHTSRLSVAGIHDPLSGLDLSALAVTVRFADVTSVPLPTPLTLLVSALIGLAGIAGRRAATCVV